MADIVQSIIPIVRPRREFNKHISTVLAVAVFLDGSRMVTGSEDQTLCLWNLKDGAMLKRMKGHHNWVKALKISEDGKFIASGAGWGELMAWDGDTGEPLTEVIRAHTHGVSSVDLSPDSLLLATVSYDKTMKFWRTDTWDIQGAPINIGEGMHCVRYSPSGELLAIATDESIQIWNPQIPHVSNYTAKFEAMDNRCQTSLAWTPDGTRLFSAGDQSNPTIYEWDTSSWKQVGVPWSGHTKGICILAINSTGTLIASASYDKDVRLWQLSNRQTIAIFRHSDSVRCVTFSADDKYILSGGVDWKISEWDIPEGAFLEDTSKVSDVVFRCKEKLRNMSWKAALCDAQKVTELNPSSYLGYYLKYAALHGAQQYDEAIAAFQLMPSKLDDALDPEMKALRQQYTSIFETQGAIRNAIDAQIEDTPPRLLDTSTGHLCNREAQINAFKKSPEYNELFSFPEKDANLQMQRIQDVVAAFFSCVMLSHRWEGKEPLLHDIQDKNVYELKPVGGIVKLQSFCKIVRDAGFRWAWVDTCCVDQNNNVELQRSVNSMFVWYRHSALTIIYLSDVPPSSKSGAMARSVWNTRGWTVQEFLAPKIVLFYQNNWTLYLDDHSPNHKESAGIMRELKDATGINERALTAFRPGMTDTREKLQWASKRVTTLPEDIAYSLFGIFGVHLSVIYGEKKQNALGRLLQEIIAQSGDISCLDWVGKSSEFNTCLPANITSYEAPPNPFILPSLSEDKTRTSISSLRDTGAAGSAAQLYTKIEQLTIPRFASRRLQLPCIIFTVTEVALRPSKMQGTHFTYAIKANGLLDLLITTEDKHLDSFSHKMPMRQQLLLARPWDRNLLGVYNFAELSDLEDDDAESLMMEDFHTAPSSPSYDFSDIGPGGDWMLIDSGSDSPALRLAVRLGQPFRAILLAQQWGGEYKRIAADHDIISRVGDMASVLDVMDVKMLEIL